MLATPFYSLNHFPGVQKNNNFWVKIFQGCPKGWIMEPDHPGRCSRLVRLKINQLKRNMIGTKPSWLQVPAVNLPGSKKKNGSLQFRIVTFSTSMGERVNWKHGVIPLLRPWVFFQLAEEVNPLKQEVPLQKGKKVQMPPKDSRCKSQFATLTMSKQNPSIDV